MIIIKVVLMKKSVLLISFKVVYVNKLSMTLNVNRFT